MSYIPGGGASDPDFAEYYKAIGLPLAGLTSPNFTQWYVPFMQVKNGTTDCWEFPTDASTRNGATIVVTSAGGGTTLLSSGTTANALVIAKPDGGQVIAGLPTSKRWYLAIRAKFSVVVSGDFMQVQINGVGQNIGIGLQGASSTTAFVLYSSANTPDCVSLGAADTNWHVLEAWSDASGTIFARLDGGTTYTIAFDSTGWTATSILRLVAYTSAGGTSRTMQIDDLLWISEKA